VLSKSIGKGEGMTPKEKDELDEIKETISPTPWVCPKCNRRNLIETSICARCKGYQYKLDRFKKWSTPRGGNRLAGETAISSCEKELLQRASDSSFLTKLSGNPRLKAYKWPIRFLRWLLRMKPEYEHDQPSLPKGGQTIKFRRYKPFQPFQPVKWEDVEAFSRSIRKINP